VPPVLYLPRVPPPRRADRVSREILRELSELIRREIKDPRVSALTLTRVDLSDDLRDATVRWVPLGGIGEEQRIAEIQSGLDKAAGFLQRTVGRNLRLRSSPTLRFRYDVGVENLVHVHELLDGLKRGSGSGNGGGSP
jgi:ribosome-binding factor A